MSLFAALLRMRCREMFPAVMLLLTTMPLFAAAPPPSGIDHSFTGQIQIDVVIASVPATEMSGSRFASGRATEAYLKELHALEKAKRAKILSQPKLVTLSGQMAAYLCGGDVAVPRMSRDEDIVPVPEGVREEVAFEEFGCKVEVLAHALHDGRIQLKVDGTFDGDWPAKSPMVARRTAKLAKGESLVFVVGRTRKANRVVIVTPHRIEPEPSLVPELPMEEQKSSNTQANDPTQRLRELESRLRSLQAEVDALRCEIDKNRTTLSGRSGVPSPAIRPRP